MEEDFPQIDLPDFGGEEAVPASAPQRAPAQPAPQQEDGDIFSGLGEAISAGLQGLQEMFGLSSAQAAVPDPRGPNMQGATAMFRGAGAYSGNEMKAIRSTVDPENKLTEGVANLAGLMNAYESFTARGDAGSAKKMAASIIQYSQQRSIALGGLALEALKDGNYNDGAKALVQAFNVIPNGQQVSIEGGVGIVKDMKSGKVVKELKLTPQVMIAAAGKLASGEDYYKMLVSTAQGKVPGEASGLSPEEENKRYEEAEKNHSAVDLRGMDTTQGRAGVEHNRNFRFQERATAAEQKAAEKAAADEKKAADKAAADEKKAADREASDEKKRGSQETAARREKEIDVVNKMDEFALIGKSKPDPTDPEAVSVKLPPRQQLEDIRDVTKQILRNNDVFSGQALRYGQQITSPKQNIKLQETEGGGTATMPDGETLNLPGKAFMHVKRIREGFSSGQPAPEAKPTSRRPSALDVFMGR